MTTTTTSNTTDAQPTNKRIAAFFDFDKTLIATDSAGKEATTILAKQYTDRWLVLFGLTLCILLNPLVERSWLSTNILNLVYYFCCYRNMSVSKLKEHAQELYLREIRPNIYQEMLNKMMDHHKQGHLVVLLSATSEHLIAPFVQEYHEAVDVCIATKIYSSNNHYTGIVNGKVCCQATKAHHVQRLALEYQLDLKNSYAYSDHHHDLKLLESVGNPSVVNPTPILEQVAKKRDWPILRPTVNV